MGEVAEPNTRRPFGMARLLWHVWRHGHAVRVNRGITVPLGDASRGWLYVCECGGVVAR